MGIVGAVMRVYSYLFHFLLALFLLGISIVSWSSREHNLQLAAFPWQGDALTYVTFGCALVGLLATWLAAQRTLPVLFLIWSVAVLAAVVRGYFLSSYHFTRGDFWTAIYVTLAALLAAVGGWLQYRTPKTKPERYDRHAAD